MAVAVVAAVAAVAWAVAWVVLASSAAVAGGVRVLVSHRASILWCTRTRRSRATVRPTSPPPPSRTPDWMHPRQAWQRLPFRHQALALFTSSERNACPEH